ncbi:hypothetical protein FisN_1Lh434 [Fistulifera solaris]|uniref:Uncharacterized protein n=1 Tax=Fistulifera solaris TaxID=1519565 RepID=A0A1Z5K3T2_FISSO|nr:hypothetical protein FisN_1Lh434 [Fistulifera solaris]|eukprot:GAX20910.1 hypothetical protein FisN_1Lh434 [Fistulifera solaris]
MNEELLELIPVDQFTEHQEKMLELDMCYPVELYRFSRKPSSLNEVSFNSNKSISIWRDNGTVICLGGDAHEKYCERCICFDISHGEITRQVAIYGIADDYDEEYTQSDAGMAETTAFFWSLKDLEADISILEIFIHGSEDQISSPFSLEALQPHQLASILDANPTRTFDIRCGPLTPEQSEILATRPYPLKLKFGESLVTNEDQFHFQDKDKGRAFVDALEKRQPLFFGSLSIDLSIFDEIPFGPDELKRLLELDISYDKLAIANVIRDKKSVLLPFSVKANSLECKIEAQRFQANAFDSLNIITRDLRLMIDLINVTDWEMYLTLFFNRVAVLGHFQKLNLLFDCRRSYRETQLFEFERIVSITKALLHAVNSNPNLSHLDLSDDSSKIDWVPHLKDIFEGIEAHKGLRFLVVESYPWTDDPDYTWLKRLLSRNRTITVLDDTGTIISDGSSVDELYSLNRFYNGSKALSKDSASLRRELVTKTLLESASNCFQRSALLLFHLTDVLCDFLPDDDSNQDEGIASQTLSEATEFPDSIPCDLVETAPKKMRAL